MPTGTKPYTRMQMAKWLTEIQAEGQNRAIPQYLLSAKAELERELAPELQVIQGMKADQSVALKEVRLEAAAYSGDSLGSGPRAEYQPLNWQ